jgi:predicted HicB family RNase H-like nuclease
LSKNTNVNNNFETRMKEYAKGVTAMSEGKSRLNVMIDSELHKELKMLAVKNGTTIVELVTNAVKEYLEKNNNEK